MIPNGVDFDRYHPSSLSKLECPADLESIKRPIAGYTGTLHSSRLDLNLVRNTAKEAPDISFVFVGPNCLTEQETKDLQAPNIHLLGSRSYQELANYISRFDLCMTPHLVNDFTESLDPLKLYEYMSTGKPIVSTPCAGFRDQPGLIALAQTADGFAHAIRRSITNVSATASDARLTGPPTTHGANALTKFKRFSTGVEEPLPQLHGAARIFRNEFANMPQFLTTQLEHAIVAQDRFAAKDRRAEVLGEYLQLLLTNGHTNVHTSYKLGRQ